MLTWAENTAKPAALKVSRYLTKSAKTEIRVEEKTFMSCFLLSWFPQLFLLWFQEVHSQLCAQKAQFQYIMESLKMKYSDTLVPSEIEGQLQEVTQSLQHIEEKVQGNR